MNKLKIAVIAFGVLLIGLAVLSALHQNSLVLVGYLLFYGLAIIAGVIFERGRYKPDVSSSSTDWEMTNEKFQDTTTGKWMRVRYNRRTGERDYVEDQLKG